ncbi:MAG: hypothetical protein JWR90_3513 [Marmoricola sp.]|jgi:hypothetical protein|nr:hypothetical protein [Marmoricola sp.]
MSDSFVNPIFGERAEPAPDVEVADDVSDEARGTGNGDVDTVIDSLNALDDLPVGEHVAVFEQAHESLRRALAGAGQNGPAAGRS